MENKKDDEIAKVLKYQEEKLKDIEKIDLNAVEKNIEDSEKLLKSLGYQIKVEKNKSEKKVLKIDSWENILEKAQEKYSENVNIEELFDANELEENKRIIEIYNNEFNNIYKLDKYDVMIPVLAGIIESIVDIVLVGIPQSGRNGVEAGKLSDFVREYFDKIFPEEEMEKLAQSKVSKVPFDAQDNRNTKINVDGLSAYYHRLLQLGHDPLLGLVFGVKDILNGTMTTIDKSGKFVIQTIDNYADRKESDIFSAIVKQLIHYASDITTSMGLPAPLMSLFNFLQIGKIGENEQTIAEIVQGMYYQGYDFIHFCSMSIPVMITEVIVRIGYALKKINEGYSIKESIPFSVDREKNPKLATMLFLAHSTSSAINAGKIAFTKNPMAINYPEWIAFLKYSYSQLKWGLVNKPELRDKFVMNKIDYEITETFEKVETTFESFCENYILLIE